MNAIEYARRLAAIAQSGLTYATDPFDIERYEQLRELAADALVDGTGFERSAAIEHFARDAGYATPKVDVRGVVFRDDALLMVRERSDGGWTLPGGWADVWDSPGGAAVREVREEAGYDVEPVKLLALFDRRLHDHPPLVHATWKVFIRCRITGGAPADSIETDGCAFFTRDAIPPLSRTRVSAGQVATMFHHLDDPARPADFD